MIQAIAPGKLVICGEYAVLDGAPAIVGAFNRYAVVNVSENRQGNFSIESPDFGIDRTFFEIRDGNISFLNSLPSYILSKLTYFIRLFEITLKEIRELGSEIYPSDITIDTKSFFKNSSSKKLGLGSSAALAVSLIAALRRSVWKNSDTDNQELFKAAHEAHNKTQGKNGSGIDIAASVYGGIRRFEVLSRAEKKDYKNIPDSIPEGIYYYPVWTGEAASTPNMMQTVGDFRENNPKEYDRIMQKLFQEAISAADSASGNNKSGFLGSIENYYQLLKELGIRSGTDIVSESHLRIHGIADKFGCIYKPSGAGGGDFGLIFTTDPDNVNRIKPELQKFSYEIMDLKVTDHGILVKEF